MTCEKEAFKRVFSAKDIEYGLESPLIIAQKSCHHNAPLITHESDGPFTSRRATGVAPFSG